MAARWDPVRRGWSVSLWSHAADAVEVVVADRDRPTEAVLTRSMQRVGDNWRADIAASDVGDADLYGFRVHGAAPAGASNRFDPAKLLVDPETTEVWFPPEASRDLARVHGADTLGRAPFGVLPHRVRQAPAAVGPRHADHELVIAELHVRGMTTLAPQVPLAERGTFAGLVAHIDHLRDLGVTAVELLPVHQFDPGEGNYWGYMPLAWNALHREYVAGDDPDDEFADMVHAFHEAGIEVYLDVVYNHTTEEDDLGPTYHLRGIDDAAYYVLDACGAYRDDAGCGNIVRAAHPAAGRLILDSLARFADLGVDGFRFDLASILGRDADGHVQRDSALVDAITTLAEQRNLRLIAEAWDLTAYQVGDAFPGRTWAQWNGPFRDRSRSFLRAEAGGAAGLAEAVQGSPGLFGSEWSRSVNFITAHDGFTVYDLVSYERKHNDANGHGGTDGTDDNRSWNCGWEGDDVPADIAEQVFGLRMQQMQNAFVLLLFSAGVPMMLAGDEFAQTQRGNNNPYNQDNATTWIDWTRRERFAALTAFVRDAIAVRRRAGDGPVVLHGVDAEPDLGPDSRALAWCRGDVYVLANSWWEPLYFGVHEPGAWRVALSTSPHSSALENERITLAPRSTVVLTR